MVNILICVEEKVSERYDQSVHEQTGHVYNLPKHEHIDIRVLSGVNHIKRQKKDLSFCYHECNHLFKTKIGFTNFINWGLTIMNFIAEEPPTEPSAWWVKWAIKYRFAGIKNITKARIMLSK